MSLFSLQARHPNIAVIVVTLFDDVKALLKLLINQTLKPQCLVIATGTSIMAKLWQQELESKTFNIPVKVTYVKPDLREHVGVRVAKAINQALRTLDLSKIDYLLKVDGDVLMKTDYIEACLSLKADLVGLGPFMLVKVKPFLRLLGGRWPETPADDAYIMMLFNAKGLRVVPSPPGLLVRRKGGTKGGWRYYYLRGIDDWKIGFDPIKEFFAVLWLIVRRRSLLPIFTLTGYLVTMFKGEDMYEFGSINFVSGLRHHVGVITTMLSKCFKRTLHILEDSIHVPVMPLAPST